MAKIAILGFGTVGGGVYGVLQNAAEQLAQAAGEPLEVAKVLDPRDLGAQLPAGVQVRDVEEILADSSIAAVAECIGGTVPAFEYVLRCLDAKKHVVTSNKELIATYGHTLLEKARANGVNLLFEAAVGGGIPLIGPLHRSLCGNRLTQLRGILNGTTNFILTQMTQQGQSFAQALAQAQALGYAEKDPSADVDGVDALRKICILASIASKKRVEPAEAYACGIRNIMPRDARFAALLGGSLKLLCMAVPCGDGADVFVTPALVGKGEALHAVCGVTNALEVTGSNVGTVVFMGAGAGRWPTASAVAADLAEAVSVRNVNRTLYWSGETLPLAEEKGTYFVCAGAETGALCGASPELVDGADALYLFENCSRGELAAQLNALRAAGADVGVPVLIPPETDIEI